MDKAQAVAKVLQMKKIAERTNHDGERENAEAQMIKLRLAHGISNDDLAGAVAEEEQDSFSLFGARLFSRTTDKEKDAIRAAVDAALAKLEKLDPLNRSKDTARFFKFISDLTDDYSKLKRARDQAVKAYFDFEVDQRAHWEVYETRNGRVVPRPPTPEEVAETKASYSTLEFARDRAATWSDLRKDHVERIVGIDIHAMQMKQYWEAQGTATNNWGATLRLRRRRQGTREAGPPGWKWLEVKVVPPGHPDFQRWSGSRRLTATQYYDIYENPNHQEASEQ